VELCGRARGELSGVGEVGEPLVAAVETIAQTAGERGIAVLGDPGFALELAQRCPGGGGSSAVVGKVLDHLRAEAGLPAVIGGGPTVARAVADYEATALALGAPGTRASYRTWTRRLVAAHGADDLADVGLGELAALIAAHR